MGMSFLGGARGTVYFVIEVPMRCENNNIGVRCFPPPQEMAMRYITCINVLAQVRSAFSSATQYPHST